MTYPQPMTYPLGRVVEHDPRSRAYPARATAAHVPFVSRRWRHVGPVLDQGQIGADMGALLARGGDVTVPVR